jgi:hypothetical protein
MVNFNNLALPRARETIVELQGRNKRLIFYSVVIDKLGLTDALFPTYLLPSVQI